MQYQRQETIWPIKICAYKPWKYKSSIFPSFQSIFSYLNLIINFTPTYPKANATFYISSTCINKNKCEKTIYECLQGWYLTSGSELVTISHNALVPTCSACFWLFKKHLRDHLWHLRDCMTAALFTYIMAIFSLIFHTHFTQCQECSECSPAITLKY